MDLANSGAQASEAAGIITLIVFMIMLFYALLIDRRRPPS
jgi:hypothetical protein